MNKAFEVLTRYSKLILLVGLAVGLTSAYLERIDYHPAAVYVTDLCLVVCVIGITFWPRTR